MAALGALVNKYPHTVMDEFEIRVCGIPAIARVTHYRPGDPGRTWGPPERCYPPEPAELEWVVLDRRGRPAPWLERKLTDAERVRIGCDLIEYLEEPEYLE
jgi:hypothetical protein